MKRKFALLIALMTISITGHAVQEVVYVLDSRPVYDTNNVSNQCYWNQAYGQTICEAVARPDRPFPLPIAHNVTVRRVNGSVETFRSAYNYRPNTKITVENGINRY